MLKDSDDYNVWSAGVVVISHIGSGAATDPILDQLTLMLQDRDWLERSAALLGVAVIGRATEKKPEIINQVALLLQDPIFEVRFDAALAIGNIGDAAIPGFARQILKFEDYSGKSVNIRAKGDSARKIMTIFGEFGLRNNLVRFGDESAMFLSRALISEAQSHN